MDKTNRNSNRIDTHIPAVVARIAAALAAVPWWVARGGVLAALDFYLAEEAARVERARADFDALRSAGRRPPDRWNTERMWSPCLVAHAVWTRDAGEIAHDLTGATEIAEGVLHGLLWGDLDGLESRGAAMGERADDILENIAGVFEGGIADAKRHPEEELRFRLRAALGTSFARALPALRRGVAVIMAEEQARLARVRAALEAGAEIEATAPRDVSVVDVAWDLWCLADVEQREASIGSRDDADALRSIANEIVEACRPQESGFGPEDLARLTRVIETIEGKAETKRKPRRSAGAAEAINGRESTEGRV